MAIPAKNFPENFRFTRFRGVPFEDYLGPGGKWVLSVKFDGEVERYAPSAAFLEEVLGREFVYNPNTRDKAANCRNEVVCDDKSHTETCGQGREGDSPRNWCWRHSYLSNLEKYGHVIQLIERGFMGKGQQWETAMIKNLGLCTDEQMHTMDVGYSPERYNCPMLDVLINEYLMTDDEMKRKYGTEKDRYGIPKFWAKDRRPWIDPCGGNEWTRAEELSKLCSGRYIIIFAKINHYEAGGPPKDMAVKWNKDKICIELEKQGFS